MKPDESNPWLEQDSSLVDLYFRNADIILVERNRTHIVLMSLFRYHFEIPKNLNILDLGCGDGILTKRIRDRYPDNNFILMDGSSDMIEKAKENLTGDNVSFRQHTFKVYINTSPEEMKYDFVHSANAIHHLDLEDKEKLFTRIYHNMQDGGLFVNIDPVKPSSARSEKWQFKLWTDLMNETLLKSGFNDDIGKYDRIPTKYKTANENKPDTLHDQLSLLKKIGFKDVDCFYKYGIFSVFGGTK